MRRGMGFASESSEILRVWVWAAPGAICCLLAFMAIRRICRRGLLRRRDNCFRWVRENWGRIVARELKPSTWLSHPLACEVVEQIAFDSMDAADETGRTALRAFFRESGLLDRALFEARHARGRRLRGVIHKPGRMRAVEAVPSIS